MNNLLNVNVNRVKTQYSKLEQKLIPVEYKRAVALLTQIYRTLEVALNQEDHR